MTPGSNPPPKNPAPAQSALAADRTRCVWCGTPRARWAPCKNPRCSSVQSHAPVFSYRDLRREAERELSHRKRIYPVRINDGRLTNYAASKQLAMMQAIVGILHELEKTEMLAF